MRIRFHIEITITITIMIMIMTLFRCQNSGSLTERALAIGTVRRLLFVHQFLSGSLIYKSHKTRGKLEGKISFQLMSKTVKTRREKGE